jgi:hypothetical protein
MKSTRAFRQFERIMAAQSLRGGIARADLSQSAWNTFFVLGFLSFAYSWFVPLKKSNDKSLEWCDWLSFMAVVL